MKAAVFSKVGKNRCIKAGVMAQDAGCYPSPLRLRAQTWFLHLRSVSFKTKQNKTNLSIHQTVQKPAPTHTRFFATRYLLFPQSATTIYKN
jgi:hypothetical protein